MVAELPPGTINKFVTESLELSREELQKHRLIPGVTVQHPMFDVDLIVIDHIGSLVRVSYRNPLTHDVEEALLPQDELYYSDLAAGILILQLSRY